MQLVRMLEISGKPSGWYFAPRIGEMPFRAEG